MCRETTLGCPEWLSLDMSASFGYVRIKTGLTESVHWVAATYQALVSAAGTQEWTRQAKIPAYKGLKL